MQLVATLLTLWLADAPDGSASATLRLDISADASSLCPAGELLATSLAQRLPQVRITSGGGARGDDLAVALRPAGDAWELTVRGADGALALVRRLEVPAAGCAGLAELGALIIDRLLEKLAWSGLTVPAVVAMPPHGIPLLRGVRLGLAAEARLGRGLDLGGGLTAEAELASGLRFGLALVAYVERRFPVVLDDPSIGEERRGALFVVPAMVRLNAGSCWRDFCGSLLGGATVVHAAVRGRYLHGKQSVWRWAGTVGVELAPPAITLPIWGVELGARVGGVLTPAPSSFTITGLAEPVYRGPVVALLVVAEVRHGIFF